MIQVEIIVSGRVQGVGYRYFVVQKAKEMEIKGWVRNSTDGSVIIVAQGIEEELKTFIDYLYVGPALSRVDRISVNRMQLQPVFDNFTVKY